MRTLLALSIALVACSARQGDPGNTVPETPATETPVTAPVDPVATSTTADIPGPASSTTSPEAANTGATPVAPDAPKGTPEPQEKFALVVSFYSPGDGTDAKAFEKLKKLLKDQKKPVAVVSTKWGKEGEHDECFQLAELSPTEKTAFIDKVKKEMSTSKKVNITENGECKGNK